MTFLGAFFRLIRWPNLVYIGLTQLLFYYCAFLPLYTTPDLQRLLWLMTASILIAAGGYVINDYFDLNIDQVNKPGKNVFARLINRRRAIIWHFVLSLLGIFATMAAVGLYKWYLVLANIGCVMLLWLYSTSFKRQLLIGNLVISLLSAWTVLVVFFAYTEPGDAFAASTQSSKLFRVAFLYAGFAFIISLIREAIKDMEDLEGDARYGCRTLPIVSGIRATKIYTTVWIVVLVAALVILQLYILQFGWWVAAVYSTLFVILPLLKVLMNLRKATSSAHFASLSRSTKWIMLGGIFSMLFFLFYL
jgi:4-hydroxybenzoate polyprenyltransferase